MPAFWGKFTCVPHSHHFPVAKWSTLPTASFTYTFKWPLKDVWLTSQWGGRQVELWWGDAILRFPHLMISEYLFCGMTDSTQKLKLVNLVHTPFKFRHYQLYDYDCMPQTNKVVLITMHVLLLNEYWFYKAHRFNTCGRSWRFKIRLINKAMNES